jgi:hypothetical protein
MKSVFRSALVLILLGLLMVLAALTNPSATLMAAGNALRWRRNDRDRFLRRFVNCIAVVKSFLARGAV